jgi:PhnB protein
MASILNPYVNFRGEAEAALAFYHGVFGGKLVVDTFSGFGMPTENPAEADWVMHGQLETPAGFTLMASDVPSGMPYAVGSNISISLSGDNDAELTGYWDKLADGAIATAMPLGMAPWGAKFGMLTDRFGIGWLVNIAMPK